MPSPQLIKARWILPPDRPPIHNGCLELQGNRILAVRESVLADRHDIDLGESAIVSGLVNAHTHLEFSELNEPLGRPGIAFGEWIEEVVAYRLQRLGQTATLAGARQEGYRESLDEGVVAVGEIASLPVDFAQDYHWVRDDCHLVAFVEQLGRNEALLSARLQAVMAVVDETNLPEHCRLGLSPHAPYSVHPQLLTGLCKLSEERGLPAAMHLAETREELQLMAGANGPLVDCLEALQAWFPETYRPPLSPRMILEALERTPRALVIHGNYLSVEDREWLGDRRERMSVVFCPRTHAFFQHDRYPLPEMLQAGVRVAVGTDSRASSPDLRLLEELRLVAKTYPELPAEAVLNMGTLAGAEALGLPPGRGALVAGGTADLSVITTGEPMLEPFGFLSAPRAEAHLLRARLAENRL